jgi:hypothetical protein
MTHFHWSVMYAGKYIQTDRQSVASGVLIGEFVFCHYFLG